MNETLRNAKKHKMDETLQNANGIAFLCRGGGQGQSPTEHLPQPLDSPIINAKMRGRFRTSLAACLACGLDI